MNLNSLNLKLIIGIAYLVIISIGLYFLFSFVDIKDLTSYEFIRSNKNLILKYKNENFLFLTCTFFIFSIIWVLLLGFAMPLLVFAGFVFGKWWGILIVLTSTTLGATLLYMLVGFFFRKVITEKLAPKFSKLKEFFIKNDVLTSGKDSRIIIPTILFHTTDRNSRGAVWTNDKRTIGNSILFSSNYCLAIRYE